MPEPRPPRSADNPWSTGSPLFCGGVIKREDWCARHSCRGSGGVVHAEVNRCRLAVDSLVLPGPCSPAPLCPCGPGVPVTTRRVAATLGVFGGYTTGFGGAGSRRGDGMRIGSNITLVSVAGFVAWEDARPARVWPAAAMPMRQDVVVLLEAVCAIVGRWTRPIRPRCMPS